jgi:hypothetical protein
MSAQGHTPGEFGEPWRTDEHFPWFVVKAGDHKLDEGQVALFKIARPAHVSSREEANSRAARAVACVNACAGLPDPERDVAEMRGLLFRCGEFLNDLGYGETELSERIRAILARADAKGATP